jgi:hypothetical protein
MHMNTIDETGNSPGARRLDDKPRTETGGVRLDDNPRTETDSVRLDDNPRTETDSVSDFLNPVQPVGKKVGALTSSTEGEISELADALVDGLL